jgi:hypothetical protein
MNKTAKDGLQSFELETAWCCLSAAQLIEITSKMLYGLYNSDSHKYRSYNILYAILTVTPR